MKASVLIVEDDAGIREGLLRALARPDLELRAVATLALAREEFARAAPSVTLLDLRLPDGDGLEFLEELDIGTTRRSVIVTTAYGDEARTIRAMRLGALDYQTKPFHLPALRAVIERALSDARVAPPLPATVARLVGQSAVMQEVWKAIGRAAGAEVPVLITGETGSGKEIVARAIHEHGIRATGPFVAVNLSGLAPGLLESELFGHERGAFTGAERRRVGRVEQAEGGTLFLDEIGDLDVALQTKLLRLLQEKSYESVGGSTRSCNVRFLAATSLPVRPGAEGVRLREDLYYRLAVMELHVPALAARRDDIPLLVQRALADTSARSVSDEALAQLQARAWPGNVRELFHVVYRAAVQAPGGVIQAWHLSAGKRPDEAPTFEALEKLPLREALDSVERELVLRAIARCHGNRVAAAKELGIARSFLYSRLKTWGIDR
jgi:DNA-binding NtrC family response regulator